MSTVFDRLANRFIAAGEAGGEEGEPGCRLSGGTRRSAGGGVDFGDP